MNLKRVLVATTLAASASLPLAAQWPSAEKIDLDAVYRIKEEGLERSQVMDTASYLTDVYGPRLTGSPDTSEAADWAQKTMKSWGLSNVHTEKWMFGRGWRSERVSAMALTPRAYPLIAYPKAWTPGTNGPVTGDAVIAVVNEEKDFETFRGQLRGKFVLTVPMRDVPAHFEPAGRRYTDVDLAELAKQPAARGRGGRGNAAAAQAFARKRNQFWIDEGVAAVLDFSRGDDGTVFVQGGGSRDPKAPPVPPMVTLEVEHYGRILRTLQKKIPVTLQMDIVNRFYDDDQSAFNIVGELRGTDKADEVVMLGGHFDSWNAATGATDNGAGSSDALEAIRLLKAVGAHPRRTIRVALWSGEEEGLYGSIAYVAQHFGSAENPKPEWFKFNGYLNIDSGTGKPRSASVFGPAEAAKMVEEPMSFFKDWGFYHVNPTLGRSTGGTDSTSFNNAGLPGIGYGQDPFDYGTFTHHTSYDTMERIYEPDVREAAVEEALTAYALAMADQMLPRCSAATMPPPPPEPAGRGAGAGRANVPVTPVREFYGPPLAEGQTPPPPTESCTASAPSGSATMKGVR